MLLIVALLAYKPDLKPYIDNMPHWTRDMFNTGALLPKGPPQHASAEPPT